MCGGVKGATTRGVCGGGGGRGLPLGGGVAGGAVSGGGGAGGLDVTSEWGQRVGVVPLSLVGVYLCGCGSFCSLMKS